MFCLRIMFTILSTTTLKGALKNYQPWFHPSIFVKHHEAFDIKHIQTLHPENQHLEPKVMEVWIVWNECSFSIGWFLGQPHVVP